MGSLSTSFNDAPSAAGVPGMVECGTCGCAVPACNLISHRARCSQNQTASARAQMPSLFAHDREAQDREYEAAARADEARERERRAEQAAVEQRAREAAERGRARQREAQRRLEDAHRRLGPGVCGLCGRWEVGGGRGGRGGRPHRNRSSRRHDL
jgi:hypothetical protein